jgi:hypothetical protein
VKLFEFYVETRYSWIKEFLEKYFGSVGNCTKLIRKYDSFQEIFESEGLRYEVTTLMPGVFNQLFWVDSLQGEFEEYKAFKSKELQLDTRPPVFGKFPITDKTEPNLGTALFEVIPYLLFKGIGQPLQTQTPISVGFTHWESESIEGLQNYYHFPNYFFCSPGCHQRLVKGFAALKGMLV